MNDERDERYRQMTTAPVTPLLVRMSIPTIIGMLVSAIYNLTDAFFIGKTGVSVYIAAIGVVFNLMTLIQAVGFMYGHGSGNYMSRMLGKKEYGAASEMAATGFMMSVLTGTAIAVAGLVFKDKLVTLLGGSITPELEEACSSYITIILLAVPAMTGTFTLNNQLRLQGSAADGMKAMMVGMVLNIVLDPVFIFLFKLNIMGAGIATLIGQYVGFVMLFIMTKKHGNIQIELYRCNFSASLLGELFAGGAPNLIRQGITTISGIMLTHAAGSFGDGAISAMTIAQRVCGISFSIVLGFGQGFQPICGYNFGAERYDRIKNAFYSCLKITTAFLAVASAAIFFAAPGIVHGFEKSDPLIIETGINLLRYQCVVFVLLSYYTIMGMMLQNIGKFFLASVVSSLRQGICFIPLVLTFPKLFGITGLYLIQPAADIVSFVITLFIGIATMKYLEKLDFYW